MQKEEKVGRKWIFVPFILLISFLLFAPIFDNPSTVISTQSDNYVCNSALNIIQNIAAEKLQENLKKYVQIERYKRDNRFSYCNIFAIDILDNRCHTYWGNQYGFLIDDYQYDVSSIYKTAFSVLSVNIKTAYDKSLHSSKVKRLTQEQAFYEAQKGKIILVISKRYNHMAIVFPEFGEYDKEKGVMIAQAGYFNGIFRISSYECFSYRWKNKEILFLEFPIRIV
jgi:hypothetical protein